MARERNVVNIMYLTQDNVAVLFVYLFTKGLCTMIAVSWYAFNITEEFFDPFYPGTK